MEALLNYFLKMMVFSSLMFGYYFVFLKDKTFHHYNRFYLLSIVVVSIMLPLIKVEYFTIEVNPDIYLLLNQFNVVHAQNTTPNDFNVFSLAIPFVGLVSLIFIVKFSIGLLKIQKLKRQYPKIEFEGIHFYETPLEDAPFSFFKNLFWKDSIPLQSDLGKQILKHEMVHIEQKHTWDKIIISTVSSIFWFNPIFYFLKKEIALIHEYLADKKAIKQSDTKAFAQMLLQTHFTENTLPATSPFLSSNLKKRLIMLKKSHTKYSYARKILALPLVFAIGFAFLVNAKNREISKTNLEIAEAVSQIKKDTIRTEATAVLVNDSGISFADRVNQSNEKMPFFIGKKKVSKSEYLKYYYINKEKTNIAFFYDIIEGTTNPKSYGVIDLNDKENVGYGRAYDEKLDGKMKSENVASLQEFAIYTPKGLNKSLIENANKSTENDKFFINYKKSTKTEFLKLLNSDKGKSNFYFGFMASPKNENYKVFSAIVNPDMEVPAEYIELTNKLTEYTIISPKNKAGGYYSGTAVYVEDGKTLKVLDNKFIERPVSNQKKIIDKQDDKQDNPWLIGVEAHPQKSIDNDKVAAYAVASSFEEDSLNLTEKYNKIYINGKLSTQADLNKIDRKKIKTENIKKNNDNGKIYNEIRIRTRK